jgi:lipopolysaccharide/colanic/teichoic acid biosynthesis glycosyltransferase
MPERLFKNLNSYHTINSKRIKNDSFLIVLDYDYFLQKKDFKTLLYKFQKIIVIPLKECIHLDISLILKSKDLSASTNLTIVYNPFYQGYLGNALVKNIEKNNRIKVKNVWDFCENYLKKCYVSDNISIENPNIENLTHFGFKTRLIKKSIDWIVGVSIYFLSQPLWLISAIKIHLESPGPIFYRQDRVGIRKNEFQIIKFRSMQTDAEVKGAQFSKKKDTRIFPWGKTMRSTRIDELPQLFNILKGELSLIGPRPERKIFIAEFEKQIPQYNERHVVKPGISGYAQIMYPYGSGVIDARHKLMYDLYYIKNWTLILEIEIFIKTIIAVVTKKGI